MTFTGNEDHSITLPEAAHLTKNYRDNNPTGATLGHYFGEKAILKILAQESCVGIRIYYAQKDDGTKQLVITGVNANGDDLYTGVLAEKSQLCPPYCGGSNSLNS
ncbi:MAG: hypothetical protein KF900_09490 [Bacteroidetes bacterium]|nr:hypothetical protein [Bacteroidota bacterium]